MANQYMGLTPPMSTALPTESEKRATESLLEELRRQHTFETPEGIEKRKQVLESLREIGDAFVRKVAQIKEPQNKQLIKNARCNVFPYGGFRLGVYGPGSDIDTLLVVPKYINRDDYFAYFPDLLMQMAPKGSITDLTAVPTAYAPIIKFEYSGISIDLNFGRILCLKELPAEELNLRDNNLLRGLDEIEVRALNGTRVADEILSLVPEPSTFRQTLRAIKLWAQRRALYANIMGFPGGVVWAIMVARICQLYPKATSSLVIHKFFAVMMKWPWPTAVQLKNTETGPFPLAVWHQTGKHIMPIITPAYPAMCATHSITHSTMHVILDEVKAGFDVTAKIIGGNLPWSNLFTKHTFFTKDYKYYISIVTTSKTKESQNIWSGYIESRVRILGMKLEGHYSIKLARPYSKGFERIHHCKTSQFKEVADGSLAHLVKEAPETKQGEEKEEETEDAKTCYYSYTHYIGLDLNSGAKSLDLSYEVNSWKKETLERAQITETYDEELNFLQVLVVRNFDLPDDVFQPGETKPLKKAAVKKQSTNGAARGQKRINDAEEHTRPAAKRQQV